MSLEDRCIRWVEGAYPQYPGLFSTTRLWMRLLYPGGDTDMAGE